MPLASCAIHPRSYTKHQELHPFRLLGFEITSNYQQQRAILGMHIFINLTKKMLDKIWWIKWLSGSNVPPHPRR